MKTIIHQLLHSKLCAFARFFIKRFQEVQVPQIAGSLTFTVLLALVPLLTVMLVVLAAFPMFSDFSDAFVQLINDTIVPSSASAVTNYLLEFKNQAGSLTAAGIIMMVFTSLLLIQTIDQTFNRIWRIQKTRPLIIKLPIYWALLTLGPVIVGFSLSLSTSVFHSEYISPFSGSIHTIGQLIFDCLILWILYRYVPNRFVPAKHALIGASITALLLETTKWGFGVYISHFNSYKLIYGAFAAIPVFLVWLHLLWMIILSGAVLTACLSYWQHNAFLNSQDTRHQFNHLLQILSLLATAQQQSQTLTLHDFRQHIALGYDCLDDLLHQLATHNYIEFSKHGWLLKTAPAYINLHQLFEEFVYTPEQNNQLLAAIIQNNITLADWLNTKK